MAERKNSLTKADNLKTHSGTHSNSPKPGAPKKHGAGGRGTWGKEGSEYTGAIPSADESDPNYDSEGEVTGPPRVPQIQEFKNRLKRVIDEYYVSGDASEAADAIKELDYPEFSHEIVKILVSSAMDMHDRERELVSELLPRLNPSVLSYEHIATGFTTLLQRLDDLALDIPNASNLVANFLARAVIDELLPPKFLSADGADIESAKLAMRQAAATVAARGAAYRAAHIWGPGGQQSVKAFKERVVGILGEYINNTDLHEADKSVRELSAPSFHYYLVKKAVLVALESSDANRDKIIKLLDQFHKSGILSESHIISGYKLTAEALKDVELDTPGASKVMEQFVQRSISTGFLPSSFTETYKQATAAPQKN